MGYVILLWHSLSLPYNYFQINEHNPSGTEAPFLDFYISICNGIVSTKIYDKQDDFAFDIENCSFLKGNIPQRPS